MNDTIENQVSSENKNPVTPEAPAPEVKKVVQKERKPFEGLIGQRRAIDQLRFFHESYLHTRRIPHLLLDAPKGQGKTTLAREVARGLVLFDDKGKLIMNPDTKKPAKKPLVTINCSAIKGVGAFINSYVIPFIQDKDVTVFFDEASELNKGVTNALLTILESADNTPRTQFAYEEYVCEFDFTRQSFIFATSEVQKVFHALVDRLERITLQDYTPSELSKIVKKFCPTVEFEKVKIKGEKEPREVVLDDVATVLRGNARNARKMGEKIVAFLMGKTKFGMDEWESMKKKLGIYPLGLTPMEIQILRILADHQEGVSLTHLSAATGYTRDALQKDIELYLQRMNLMKIETAGRVITPQGLEYLRSLLGNRHFAPTGVVQHK